MPAPTAPATLHTKSVPGTVPVSADDPVWDDLGLFRAQLPVPGWDGVHPQRQLRPYLGAAVITARRAGRAHAEAQRPKHAATADPFHGTAVEPTGDSPWARHCGGGDGCPGLAETGLISEATAWAEWGEHVDRWHHPAPALRMPRLGPVTARIVAALLTHADH